MVQGLDPQAEAEKPTLAIKCIKKSNVLKNKTTGGKLEETN